MPRPVRRACKQNTLMDDDDDATPAPLAPAGRRRAPPPARGTREVAPNMASPPLSARACALSLALLPEVLMEVIIAISITRISDVPAVASVCTLWQRCCELEQLWKRLACDHFEVVARQAATGVAPASWKQVARDHTVCIRLSEHRVRRRSLIGGSVRDLLQHEPVTTLSQYVFHVQLAYDDQLLGEWTGSIGSVGELNFDEVDGFQDESGYVNAANLKLPAIRLWTDEAAPCHLDVYDDLDLPVDADDEVEKWDKILLHVYASHHYRITKLYCAGLVDSNQFDTCSILDFPTRRTRLQARSEQNTPESYNFSPSLFLEKKNDPFDPDDLSLGTRAFDWIWGTETRLGLSFHYFDIRDKDAVLIRPAKDAELLLMLELLLVDGSAALRRANLESFGFVELSGVSE